MTDELDRLEALGRTQPPPADPLFVAALGGRLGAVPRRRRVPLVLPAAALAALVLGFVLLLGGGKDTRTLVVETAADSNVRPGAALRDGDVVTTGPSGSVTVAGETIGPGERAVVRRGRLQRRTVPETLTLQSVVLPRGGTALRWTRYQGTDFGRYVVVRQLRPVAQRRGVDQVVFVDRRPRFAPRVRYVVVVLDGADRAVARSNVLTVE